MISPLTVSDWPIKTQLSLESFDCEFWCNFDTHCLSGYITVGISLGRCVMTGVISDHTAHIARSYPSVTTFSGAFFGSTDVPCYHKRHPRK